MYNFFYLGQNKTITFNDILTMNIFGDLEDLESALSDPQQKMPNKVQGRNFTFFYYFVYHNIHT